MDVGLLGGGHPHRSEVAVFSFRRAGGSGFEQLIKPLLAQCALF